MKLSEKLYTITLNHHITDESAPAGPDIEFYTYQIFNGQGGLVLDCDGEFKFAIEALDDAADFITDKIVERKAAQLSAAEAQRAIEAHRIGKPSILPEESLRHLLYDLIHWADSQGISFDYAHTAAIEEYKEEKGS